ncbi:hypothetical protein SK128_002075 [Halocaridina rubra]|uniref:Uncharacterized protein n=1 Tax=Halocaridina rubra TaxID=373956 RepID=A0AAN8X347_HALRR
MVLNARDLGVNILAELSPEMHISDIVRAAYAFLANGRVTFKYMAKEMFRNIYETCVRPRLEYAAPFWNSHLKKHKEKYGK